MVFHLDLAIDVSHFVIVQLITSTIAIKASTGTSGIITIFFLSGCKQFIVVAYEIASDLFLLHSSTCY